MAEIDLKFMTRDAKKVKIGNNVKIKSSGQKSKGKSKKKGV